jgi:hypothetical protein
LYPEGRQRQWLSREPFRPFGYNLVELSRFAGGPFGISIARPARSLRVFADP